MDKFLKRPAGASTSEAGGSKAKVNRIYDDAYLQYGFTAIDNKPQCVICGQVLAQESMKPSKLLRHLLSKHENDKDKPLDYFQRKLDLLRNQRTSMCQSTKISEKASLASYKVAYLVGKNGKPHTIAENLILPAAVDMVEIMIGEKEAHTLKAIPLSDNTIERRLSDIAADIRNQVVEKVKKSSYFSLQFDESTDISSCAQFVCYVRFENLDQIAEEMLFCKDLQKNATAECLYELFIESTQDLGFDWELCVGICTDGARAMTGNKSGFVARLKTKMPNAHWTHCFLHRQALAAKFLPSNLNDVLNSVIKVVNCIKGKALQTRLFRTVCEDMGALHQNLLFHTEVRWLSKGNVLTRVIELRSELNMFLKEKDPDNAKLFTDPTWLLKVAYISDIFRHLNILNTSMQGRDENIISAKDKIKAFVSKIEMWLSSLQHLQFGSFTCFESIAAEISSDELVRKCIPFMTEAVQNLKQELHRYFPRELQEDNSNCWILNPFLSSCAEVADLGNILNENLCELAADSMLKMEFLSENISTFWIKRKTQYPDLAKRALKILTQFSTSYLCEMTFSQMVNIKTKKRNKLNIENDLIVCMSRMEPRYSKLLQNKQAHPSH